MMLQPKEKEFISAVSNEKEEIVKSMLTDVKYIKYKHAIKKGIIKKNN